METRTRTFSSRHGDTVASRLLRILSGIYADEIYTVNEEHRNGTQRINVVGIGNRMDIRETLILSNAASDLVRDIPASQSRRTLSVRSEILKGRGKVCKAGTHLPCVNVSAYDASTLIYSQKSSKEL